MTTQEMADKILKAVQGYGPGASFVDIENVCGEEALGDRLVTIPTRDNTVLWDGVSEKFIDAFNLVKHQIALEGSCALIYVMDGKILTLPIAKRPGKKDYKKPRWFPVTFRMKAPSEMTGVPLIPACS
jgi:hypothetical protein